MLLNYLFQNFHLDLTPRTTWKWISKYADNDIPKTVCNSFLSVKHTHNSITFVCE